tara:strand:+ start:1911 stop:2276 length:366 start_codon:yes stop_codon:yes gene_type:complete
MTKKSTKKDANEASTEPLSNSEVADFLEKQKKFQNSVGQQWKNRLSPEILGQRIVRMQYMSKKDAEGLGWYKRPLMLMLENGTWIIPQQDDEGNDGSALWLMNNNRELKETLAPVITIADD